MSCCKLTHFLKRGRPRLGRPEPELKTKFSKGEKKVYNQVLKLFESMMKQVNAVDSGPDAIRVFCLFLQDLDDLGKGNTRHASVYKTCFFCYSRALVDLILQHGIVDLTEKEKGLNP